MRNNECNILSRNKISAKGKINPSLPVFLMHYRGEGTLKQSQWNEDNYMIDTFLDRFLDRYILA